jgi:hypothetical protein
MGEEMKMNKCILCVFVFATCFSCKEDKIDGRLSSDKATVVRFHEGKGVRLHFLELNLSKGQLDDFSELHPDAVITQIGLNKYWITSSYKIDSPSSPNIVPRIIK